MLLFNVGMFPGRLAEQPLVRQGQLWVPARSPGWQAGPAMRPESRQVGAMDDGVNGHKAIHKAKHLLLKEEAERQR